MDDKLAVRAAREYAINCLNGAIKVLRDNPDVDPVEALEAMVTMIEVTMIEAQP